VNLFVTSNLHFLTIYHIHDIYSESAWSWHCLGIWLN